MDEKDERYCSIEESLIEACKEVNLMRKGLLPEQSDWREWLAELEKELEEEEALEAQSVKKRRVAI